MEGSAAHVSSTHATDTHEDGQLQSTNITDGAMQVAQTLSPPDIEYDADIAIDSIPPEVKELITISAAADDSTAQLSMPDADTGLNPQPSVQNLRQGNPSPFKGTNSPDISTSPPHFSRPSPNKSTAVTPEQPYYDSAAQPLSVSQQTSASAVRDMALRKGTSSVLKKSDQPGEQRPLKSAMKPFSPAKVDDHIIPSALYPLMAAPSPSKTGIRFPKWSSLLSRSSSGGNERSNAFSALSRTASGHSGHSERLNTPNNLRPKRSIGWDQPLQQYDEARNTPVQSDVSDRVRQAKLAEGDVYEKAKMNVRRPPKGIQNWFDGFEISSEEDDATPLAKPGPQRASAQHTNEAYKQSFEGDIVSPQQRSHDSSHHSNALSKAERLLGHSIPPARADHDSLHDRLVPAEHDRSQDADHGYFEFAEGNLTPKAQSQAYRNAGYSSSHHTSSNSRGSSYDTGTDRSEQHHRGTDHYSNHQEAAYHARTVDVSRPIIPPRRMQNVHGSAHEQWRHSQMHNNQSASSRPPLVSHNSSSKFSSHSRRTLDEHEEEDEGRTSTFKSYTTTSSSSTAARNRGRANTRIQGHGDPARGALLESLSAELHHTMAVTEEEMALLEMMRNKRAAMNKTNYTRGYRKALEREHEQLMQRRLLAQQTALQILRDQQQLYSRRDETEETNETTDDGEVDEHEIMRLDKLRLEELHRIQRLEKFLATNASLAAALQDTGLHHVERHHREKGRRPSGSDSRPRLTRADSGQQESDRSRTGSRHQRRSELRDDSYGSPLDLPSPPLYDDERFVYAERPKKHRSNIKASRHLATLEEERLSAAFERAQRKSRTILANHSTEALLAQQAKQPHNESDRVRRKTQTPTFLRSVSDFPPVEHRSATSRDTSVNASVVSPLTPNSLEPQEPGKHESFGALDSEDEMRFARDIPSPELNFSKPSRGLVPVMADQRRSKKQLPSALAIIADEEAKNERESMESSGSAGGDVLAAWAELGGAEGLLSGRRPRVR